MEPKEHDVRHGAGLEDSSAKEVGRLVPAAPPDLLQVRRLGVDDRLAAQPAGGVEEVRQVPLVVLQPQKHIHQHRLVAQVPQGPADAGAGYQGYVPLGGQAPRQYDDIQIRYRSLALIWSILLQQYKI